MTADDIQCLIDDGAQESLYLEFKRGEALGRQNNQRTEIVKDVTGFANADGGRIVYGLAEGRSVEGVAVAHALSPVTDAAITREWLSSTIHDHSSPRLHDFDIEEIAVEGGRVIVVDIKAAGTAHQTLLGDLRYYQRVGVTTRAIEDFRVRDLMARGTRPVVDIRVWTQNMQITAELHRYCLRVAVSNVGNVTLEKWWLSVDVPTEALRDSRHGGIDLMRIHGMYRHMAQAVNSNGEVSITRLSFGDPFGDGARQILHPGQTQDYDPGTGLFPQFVLEITSASYVNLRRQDRAIPWTLFLNNAQPMHGSVPFEEWCRF